MRRMVVFPDTIEHADMAKMCADLGKPASAGIAAVGADYDGTTGGRCSGAAPSLKLRAQPHDTALLVQLLNLDEGR